MLDVEVKYMRIFFSGRKYFYFHFVVWMHANFSEVFRHDTNPLLGIVNLLNLS
jgi:hypothetical protein